MNAQWHVDSRTKMLDLEHRIMSPKAVGLIFQALSYWQATADANNRASGYKQQKVVWFGGKTCAQLLADKGWITIPDRCWYQETLPAATLNHEINWPNKETLSLQYFADVLGYKDVEDVDYDGKTIFHHLFTASKYCTLIGYIALRCFDANEAKMPGRYSNAMSYKVTGGKPMSWTPLHVLCNDSDKLFATKDIIAQLLDNKIVGIESFDTVADAQVIVFFSLCLCFCVCFCFNSWITCHEGRG